MMYGEIDDVNLEAIERIAGQSMFGMHKGTQGIHLQLHLTACKNFDVGNLKIITLFHCLCGSY